MTTVPGVAPFSATKSLLEIGQFNKTNADRRAINAETNNFLEMKRSRQAREKAENALSVQESGMKQDVNKDRIAEDRHRTGARAADKAAEAKSKEQESKSELGEVHADVGKVTDEASHTRAVLEVLQEGGTLEDATSRFGETYDPDFIKVQQDRLARAVEPAKFEAADASRYGADRGYAAAQLRASTDLALAQQRLQLDLMTLKAAGKEGRAIDLKDMPKFTSEGMAAYVGMALEQGELSGGDFESIDIGVISPMVAQQANMLMAQGMSRFNDAWANYVAGEGPKPDISMDPRNDPDSILQRALISTINRNQYLPAGEQESAQTRDLRQRLSVDINIPGSPANRILEASGLSPVEFLRALEREQGAQGGR